MTSEKPIPLRARRERGMIRAGGIALLVGGIAVVVLLQWLPRLGRPVDPSGRPRVEVWSWNVAAMSLNRLVPDFEKRHPDAVIDVKMNGTNVQSRFLLSLAAGRGAPDICSMQEREAAKFTGTGRLLDLTSLAAKYEKDFSPSFWSSCIDHGRVFAIPWDMGPCAVFYKRWVFQKYDLNGDLNPDKIETWDDFLAAGKLLKQRSGGEVNLFALSTAGLGDMFLMLAQQNGGGVFDADGNIVLDSAPNAEALVMLRKFLDSGIIASTQWGPELFASFKSDNIATYPGAVWMMQTIKDSAGSTGGNWGVFRLPCFRPGALRASNMGGSVLVIPAQSERPDEAWKFVQYTLCDTENQITQFREFGLFPAYLPAHKHPFFEVGDDFFAGQKVSKLFATDIEKIPPLVRTRDWNEASRYLGQTLSDWERDRPDNSAYLKSTAESLHLMLKRSVASAGKAREGS